MQILAIRHRAPLIRDEGRERTRSIVAIRRFDFSLPRGLRQLFRVIYACQQFSAGECTAQDRIEEGLDGIGLERFPHFTLGELAVRIVKRVEHADVLRMIRHGEEIQRFVALGGAAQEIDTFTARESIGGVRIDFGAEQDIGIE